LKSFARIEDLYKERDKLPSVLVRWNRYDKFSADVRAIWLDSNFGTQACSQVRLVSTPTGLERTTRDTAHGTFIYSGIRAGDISGLISDIVRTPEGISDLTNELVVECRLFADTECAKREGGGIQERKSFPVEEAVGAFIMADKYPVLKSFVTDVGNHRRRGSNVNLLMWNLVTCITFMVTNRNYTCLPGSTT
jgi:hypothetical protein